jgi:C-terminal processing protease CtpA/Prc
MKAKPFLSVCIFFLFAIVSCSQTNNTGSKFNLGFEEVRNRKPQGWYIPEQQSYTVSLDSVTVRSGKYSLVIESTGNSVDFQMVAFRLPYHYERGNLTLSGYVKTENVIDTAGLWIRINPELDFEDISRIEVTRTTDWKRYEITLDINPAKTKQVLLGGALHGKGKMWLDDLKIMINGEDIEKAKPYQPEPFSEKAKYDRTFDTGSNIVFPKLDEQKINDLELLGRIWGFLKYHHPAVAKGEYNWDSELFRILQDYLEANDSQQRDKILLNWINKYGWVPKCKDCRTTPDNAFLKPDLSWIEKSNINLKLQDLLQTIYLNRHQGNHYYINTMQVAQNPVFSNERAYETMDCPDAGFRLLALYRYWNMIHYFSPYKYLTDKDWNIVLREYIPYFIEAKNRLEYELNATLLIGEVCDSHAGLTGNKIDSLRGDRQALFRVRFIENKLVVTNIFSDIKRADGIKTGDVITHIDGKSVEAMVDSIKKYYPASNNAVRMNGIADNILRSNKYVISIDYISSDKIKQTEVYLGKRSDFLDCRYKIDTAKCYKFLNPDIGYITLKSIKKEDIDEIKKVFKNTKGIIIDIRNYPSEFVPFSLGSYFVSGRVPFVKFTQGNPDNPGEFTLTPTLKIRKGKESYQGKLVVIVDEETISQAEYTAMAFQAGDNTTVIGSQTAGADGNVSEILLPGGLKTGISGIGIYYPDGRETQRIGIVPDVEVKPTIKGIREGRDELLEKAIEIIEQNLK